MIIPRKNRRRVLDLLHETHPGITKMAQGYVWWPGMDGDIEHAMSANNQGRHLQPWRGLT